MPLLQTGTQATPLASSARAENRARDFYTCFQGPWATHLAADDAPFVVLSTLRMSIASDDPCSTTAKRDRKSRAFTGLTQACGALGGAAVDFGDAQGDRLHTNAQYFLYITEIREGRCCGRG